MLTTVCDIHCSPFLHLVVNRKCWFYNSVTPQIDADGKVNSVDSDRSIP